MICYAELVSTLFVTLNLSQGLRDAETSSADREGKEEYQNKFGVTEQYFCRALNKGREKDENYNLYYLLLTVFLLIL